MMTSQVVPDGRAVTHGRDPPGQKSVYILPGDTERETYRLLTFQKFPDQLPVNPCQLARNGFYYTGFRDRVKCFSCGITVEDWQVGDDPQSANWHHRDCEMATGCDERNKPIDRFLPRPTKNIQPKRTLIPAGEVLMRGLEDTKSVSSAGKRSNIHQTAHYIPAPASVIASTRATEHRNNGMNNENNGRYNVNNGMDNGDNGINNENNQRNNDEVLFPCEHPAHVRMREERDRLQSFRDNLLSWPSRRIRATPGEMAEAGLYYTGIGDKVKCWYCNGGLQNWESNDQPWEEHAKWFPQCEFVLQKKGLEYVENIVSRFPSLQRHDPRAAQPPLSPAVSGASRLQSSPNHASSSETPASSTQTPASSTLTPLSSTQTALSSSEAPLQQRSRGQGETQRSLDELVSLRMCKKCRRTKASIVLLPCGHISCCKGCAVGIKRCPLCGREVEESIQSYIG